jgi:Uma2 family endonuclease
MRHVRSVAHPQRVQCRCYTDGVLNPADIRPERVRPLRRTEYDRLVAGGVFEDERVELLDGMLVTMTPQDPPHAHTVQRLAECLSVKLRDRAIVRVQSPLALTEDSEPEPDVAVVPPGDYSNHHPSEAYLVIEVATSSQRRDRLVKGPIYARGRVTEYWVVDVPSRIVEVHRRAGGARFDEVSRHREDETLRLVAFPEIQIEIRSVLPTQA